MIKILETAKKIAHLIMSALAKDLNKGFRKIRPEVLKITQDTFRQYLMQQPEYGAIVSGKLTYEFGLLDPKSRIDAIINKLVDGVDIEFVPFTVNGEKLDGGYRVSVLKPDLSDILNMSEAVQVTEKGTSLNWLEWLLTMGDKIIITTHHVVLGNFPSPPSRTGGAIMVKTGGWGVPDEYSGTVADNFITRAMREMDKPLADKLENVLHRLGS